jgi:hypothetical protein
MNDCLGVEIAFAVKITVKAAPRQARIGHNVIDRHGIEAMSVEQSHRAADYFLFYLVAVFSSIWH